MRQMLIQLLIMAFTLALPAYACAEAGDDSPVDNKSTYHISDNIDLVTAHDVQYEKPRIVIKLVFPRLSSSDDSSTPDASTDKVDNNADSNDKTTSANLAGVDKTNAFNEQVTAIIKEEISHFKQVVTDAQDAQKTMEKSKIRNRMAIDYNSAIVNMDAEPMISIRFIVQGYVSGTAHPYRRYRVLNFDLENGRVMQLSELFDSESNYLAAIAQYSEKILTKKLHTTTMIEGGTAPTETNYSNWNINPHGLRFTFDEATVAPYSYGSQTILIPYAALKEFINPESILGRCLAHRKRCMRDNLLTGGFIDEAANTSHRRLNPVFG
jgi:tRNA isopentenyl-2-thiomethyl-A-37 hydroxylase MiaE